MGQLMAVAATCTAQPAFDEQRDRAGPRCQGAARCVNGAEVTQLVRVHENRQPLLFLVSSYVTGITLARFHTDEYKSASSLDHSLWFGGPRTSGGMTT
jgi:hypothetical protein